jgi:hypothetical protein
VIRLVTFQDRQVRTLYNIARDADESLITHDQKVAIEILGSMAKNGNQQAGKALLALVRWPDLHPLLREMAAAGAGVPVRANS